MKFQVLTAIALAASTTMGAPCLSALLGGGLLGGGSSSGSSSGSTGSGSTCVECEQGGSGQVTQTVQVPADGTATAGASVQASGSVSGSGDSSSPDGFVVISGSAQTPQGSASGSAQVDPNAGAQGSAQVSTGGSGETSGQASGQTSGQASGQTSSSAPTKSNNAIPGTGADLQHQNQATAGIFGNGNTYGNAGIGGQGVATIDSITKAISSPIRGILAPKVPKINVMLLENSSCRLHV